MTGGILLFPMNGGFLMKKWYPVFGIMAPLVYALAVVIGGFMLPGYSHIYNTISELTASNAPKIPLIQILFTLYNFLLILLGIGMYRHLATPERRKTQLAAFLLVLIGVLGLGMYFFPQDPRNIAMTLNGKAHIVLAGIASIFTMIAILQAGTSFKNDNQLRWLRIYSYITFGLVFITGGLAGVSVANNAAYGGLYERLTIGAFMQWIAVVSAIIFNRKTKMKKNS
jgi:hypothetical membrane protein